MTIFSTTIANDLKDTLEDIIDDHTDGIEEKVEFTKIFEEKPMGDAYVDYLEMGGPGLAQEVPEGQELSSGSINEGWLMRFWARKLGLILDVTDEAMEDGKHEEVIAAAKRLKRALWKALDIDAANVFNRMFDSAYVGGDGIELSATNHTLPGGGTFSNEMATPLGPSEASFIVARTQVMEYPGHDGIAGDGYQLEGVAFPHGQLGAWEVVTGSKLGPEANNFAAINTAHNKLKLHPMVHWTATDTSYCYLTNVDNGLCYFWRRKPKNRTWVENRPERMSYSISARIARGWLDPRKFLGVEA